MKTGRLWSLWRAFILRLMRGRLLSLPMTIVAQKSFVNLRSPLDLGLDSVQKSWSSVSDQLLHLCDLVPSIYINNGAATSTANARTNTTVR